MHRRLSCGMSTSGYIHRVRPFHDMIFASRTGVSQRHGKLRKQRVAPNKTIGSDMSNDSCIHPVPPVALMSLAINLSFSSVSDKVRACMAIDMGQRFCGILLLM